MASHVLVLNPVCGDGQHAERVHDIAAIRGYDVRETKAEGDGVKFARDAADDGASVVAACGGDGTVNEVVRGLDDADALDSVTFGVVPCGTGNNFAGNIGVTEIDQAFDVLEDGDERRIDLGYADDQLFVNSCIAGVPADASHKTSSNSKQRLGVLAYVLTLLQEVTDYSGLELTLIDQHGEEHWAGSAAVVFVGNVRRASAQRVKQANAEDGLFDVTIVEQVPPTKLLRAATVERLFGEDEEYVTRILSQSLTITVHENDPVTFSLDGEPLEANTVEFTVREKALRVRVGDDYRPDPNG
ncbi:diacylglycerol/lipid kinase family protein [Halobacterium zhouii]|uniref:diacylglycerol/lipid kinase family protein n=1 Tax=Halobacterium zhouii TaxID=2902624 RepID=UPI001E47725E|nr:diacylglycerol kinase family protein [Halobacterium zhouii]